MTNELTPEQMIRAARANAVLHLVNVNPISGETEAMARLLGDLLIYCTHIGVEFDAALNMALGWKQ